MNIKYKHMKYIFGILFTLLILQSNAQVPAPAGAQDKPIALMNGIIHVGNGEVIDNGIITIHDGKISSIGDARAVKIDLSVYEVINVSGKHVYPGLILANSTLGLVDINAVRATRDYQEVGEFTPNVRSVIAYNTDSEVIPTFRFNGILLTQVVPRGGIISGTSSVMALDGWNWEDAAYAVDGGIHIYWPSYLSAPKWWLGEHEWQKNEEYDEKTREIEEFLQNSWSYAKQDDPQEVNLKLEAMKGLYEGHKKVYVHADDKRQIIESVQMLKRNGIHDIVLTGTSNVYYVMDFLKDNDIPVLLNKVHRLPEFDEEDVDMPFKLPALLVEKGIMVGLIHSGDVQSARNLAFYAGTAAAYGLEKEEALKLITSNPAKILGIDKTTGTLEQGKDANIVVSEGDLLDMRTNKLEYAFIRGRAVTLEGKQQMLYERYKEKYEQ
jgi:imidazolonepropionase-like amidohydrolase